MAERTCSIEGCERLVRARGLCISHYNGWRNKNGPVRTDRRCSVQGCGQTHYGKGLCSLHYSRVAKYGSLDAPERAVAPLKRFFRYIELGPSHRLGRCWLWTASVTPKGYGMFSPGPKGPKTQSVHTWTFAYIRGETIPEGLQLDHLCRVRHCANPWHLEPVTAKTNQVRSPFDPAARTHCPQGHPYSVENTYVYPNRASRSCRICSRRARSDYEARQATKGRSG